MREAAVGGWTRRGLLATLALAGCRPDDALTRGIRWLLEQQAADGSFPSRVTGLLGSGATTTPFVVEVLVGLPAPPRGRWLERALRWMAAQQADDGALTAAGRTEYPTYATALWLRALARIGDRSPAGERAARWLQAQQLVDRWHGHPAFGGWGLGGARPEPPDAGHVDLSMTRRAIEALVAWGGWTEGRDAAADFVARCAGTGGGFVYSPVDRGLNKAACEADCSSYGSATADGVLATEALGQDATAGRRWLEAHADPARNPGIPDGPKAPFADAMRGYWRSAACACFARGGPEGWRARFGAAIHAEQRPDGSWVNPSYLQKEDDPLVSTALAVQALGHIG